MLGKVTMLKVNVVTFPNTECVTLDGYNGIVINGYIYPRNENVCKVCKVLTVSSNILTLYIL